MCVLYCTVPYCTVLYVVVYLYGVDTVQAHSLYAVCRSWRHLPERLLLVLLAGMLPAGFAKPHDDMQDEAASDKPGEGVPARGTRSLDSC